MSFDVFKYIPQMDFVSKRKLIYSFSGILILIGFIAVLAGGGIKYGVDFAGGVAVQVKFEQAVDTEELVGIFSDQKFDGLFVQEFGDENEYLIRFTATESGSTDGLRDIIASALDARYPDNKHEILKLDVVGPKVGGDLRDSALQAMFYAVLLISVYISGRFEQRWGVAAGMAALLWGAMYVASLFNFGIATEVVFAMVVTMIAYYKLKLNFALGAVLALLHDVVITVGLLALFGYEIDLNIVAAILTLIGYSLNDTIIVYDRIRENFHLLKTGDNNDGKLLERVINSSINQTLSRTIMTGSTTILACLSLFFFGGSVIHGFAFTILIGILVGTYSSIFVAAPILLTFGDISLYTKKTEKVAYEKPGEHGVV